MGATREDEGDGQMMLASILPYTGGVAFFTLLLGSLLMALGTFIKRYF